MILPIPDLDRALLSAALAAVLLLAAGRPAAGQEAGSALESVVAVEREFARTASQIGFRRAFLQYFAEDALTFQPLAVPARPGLEAGTDQPGLLAWEPAYAGVSRAGDLGFTTGPWQFHPEPAGPAAGWGHYVTVWRRQADGSWRAAIDQGNAYPDVGGRDERLGEIREVRTLPVAPAAPPAGGDPAAALLAADRAFAEAAGRTGTEAAYAEFASPGIRVYRGGTPPRTGVAAALAILAPRPGRFSWTPTTAVVADSGDLGYAYGTYTVEDGAATETGGYYRIWQRHGEGPWRVVIDVLLRPAPG